MNGDVVWCKARNPDFPPTRYVLKGRGGGCVLHRDAGGKRSQEPLIRYWAFRGSRKEERRGKLRKGRGSDRMMKLEGERRSSQTIALRVCPGPRS